MHINFRRLHKARRMVDGGNWSRMVVGCACDYLVPTIWHSSLGIIRLLSVIPLGSIMSTISIQISFSFAAVLHCAVMFKVTNQFLPATLHLGIPEEYAIANLRSSSLQACSIGC